YSASGDLQSALQHLRRSVAMGEKLLSPLHPELTQPLRNLALTLFEQNKQENLEAAVGYLKRALRIQERAVGTHSPAVAEILVHLGWIECQGKQRNGLAYLQRALDIQEKTLSASSWLIALTLVKFGEAYLSLKQPHEAKPMLERAS